MSEKKTIDKLSPEEFKVFRSDVAQKTGSFIDEISAIADKHGIDKADAVMWTLKRLGCIFENVSSNYYKTKEDERNVGQWMRRFF